MSVVTRRKSIFVSIVLHERSKWFKIKIVSAVQTNLHYSQIIELRKNHE